jgi:TDG/mug DNA glycosylase family protein
MTETPPGSSAEQTAAERVMLDLLGADLGLNLQPLRLVHPGGASVAIDGADEDRTVLVEAWAHVGPPKGGQRNKPIVDAFKLLWAAEILPVRPRLILCMADDDAARPFTDDRSWRAQALRDVGVDVVTVRPPDQVLDGIRTAQRRQYRWVAPTGLCRRWVENGCMESPPSALIGHQVIASWMGSQVLTLADLVPDTPRAVVVGINPAPTSVAAGHYYQGRLGRGFFARLRAIGAIPETGGWDDDAALAAGIGFTDIIKRPTPRAADLRPDEFAHGRPLLQERLQAWKPPMVIFTFKKTADVVLGSASGVGMLPVIFSEAHVFVMPSPYAKAEEARTHLTVLRDRISGTSR